MNALQQLIRRRLDERGWSYGDVSKRGGLPRSTVHHLATTEVIHRLPQPATLERLARGLELPLQAVRDAAAEAAGIHVYRDGGTGSEVAVLMASLEQLSADDRRHVVALVESLLQVQQDNS